jgi:tRNA (cmo5U34)-methyltransferase
MQDKVMPNGKWEFDQDVTAVFDNMLERSIPQYQVMREAVTDIANKYRTEKTVILDLGCSRGDALAPLIDKHGVHNRYIGVDVSEPMLDYCRQRFKGMIDCNVVDIKKFDLRNGVPPVSASVILSILTLQFTPIEYRLKIMRSIYDSLLPDGAFIFVEKVIGASSEIDSLMVDTYYKMKASNGYSQEEIQRKRMSLEGVLVPLTARWNEEMLALAGFRQVDCFWRWMNFCGWIAIK